MIRNVAAAAGAAAYVSVMTCGFARADAPQSSAPAAAAAPVNAAPPMQPPSPAPTPPASASSAPAGTGAFGGSSVSAQIDALKQQLDDQRKRFADEQAQHAAALAAATKEITDLGAQLQQHSNNTNKALQDLEKLVTAQQKRLDALVAIDSAAYKQRFAQDRTRYDLGRQVLARLLDNLDKLQSQDAEAAFVNGYSGLADPETYPGVRQDIEDLDGTLDFARDPNTKSLLQRMLYDNPIISAAFSFSSLIRMGGHKQEKETMLPQLVGAFDVTTKIATDLDTLREGLDKFERDRASLDAASGAFFLQYDKTIGLPTSYADYNADVAGQDKQIAAKEDAYFKPDDAAVSGDAVMAALTAGETPSSLKAAEANYAAIGAYLTRYDSLLTEMDDLLDQSSAALKLRKSDLQNTPFGGMAPAFDAAISDSAAAKTAFDAAYRPDLKNWQAKLNEN